MRRTADGVDVFHRLSDGLSFRMAHKKHLTGVFMSDRPAYGIEALGGRELNLYELTNGKLHSALQLEPTVYNGKPSFFGSCGDILLWTLDRGYAEWRTDTLEIINFRPPVFMLSSRRHAVVLEFDTGIFEKAMELTHEAPGEDDDATTDAALDIVAQSLDHLLVAVGTNRAPPPVFKINLRALYEQEAGPIECVACGTAAVTACADCAVPYCSERCQELDWDVHAVHCRQ
jgi:hypothetical protein